MAHPKESLARKETADTASSSNSEASQKDDAALIAEAKAQIANEKLLVASRLLKQVKQTSLLKQNHLNAIKFADLAEAGMKDLLEPPDKDGSKWKKQTESHGHRDFFVYYHVTESNLLYSRIDCAIESSLLVPVISVLNESDLYDTWMPSWKKPFKLGIDETKKLKESGRGNQIIQVTINMAWPLSTREVVQHAVAIDAIDEAGVIVIQVQTETPQDDPIIPAPLPGVVRIDVDCSLLIRGCPPDHSCLAKSKNKYPEGEELIMISMKTSVDAHVKGVPLGLINFVTRTVYSRLWSSLLQVAEDIRDGKRPLHEKAIAEKRELYDFVESRIDVMIDKVKESYKSQEG